jgi:hypothetical protein
MEKQVDLPGGEKVTFMLILPGEFMMGRPTRNGNTHVVPEPPRPGAAATTMMTSKTFRTFVRTHPKGHSLSGN